MSNEELIASVVAEYNALLEKGDLVQALPLIRQAANWADVDSQILAERIYLHEEYGHPVDWRAGSEYALLAAMNGDITSMEDLARLYENGFGGKEDRAKADYWKKKAETAREEEAKAFAA